METSRSFIKLKQTLMRFRTRLTVDNSFCKKYVCSMLMIEDFIRKFRLMSHFFTALLILSMENRVERDSLKLNALMINESILRAI